METTRTIVLKLKPSPEQAAELDATLAAFASACDFIADVARRIHSTNKVVVQKECYRELRDTFGLAANLAIRAIARVCAALKVPEKAHSKFKPTSIDYDARIFSFREWDWTVSLTLLHSRQRIETMPGERQKGVLKGAKPTAAQMVKREGKFFLHIQLSDEAPEPIEVADFIGVTWASPGSPRRATNPKGIAASPSRGFAASTTCNESGSSERAPREQRRSSGGLLARKPGSASTRTTSSVRRSSSPPKAPDAGSPSRVSRGYATG